MSNTDSSPTASEAQPSREKIPKQIGKYELIRQLGAGGMGAVFLAQDHKTHRSVALKVLPREKATNETLVKRFRSEAQAAANLEHENIVRVYEADEANGYLYIALEYVDGTDVNCILRKRERMPVKRSIEIVRQAAKALQHAHKQGIVHRDIKPSNLMIRKDGILKLTDLGLARSIDESVDTNITRAGTTVGTVDYMAPEQARHSRLADIRSDLYSLGCTWYQMLVGHPPYHEGSLTNKLQAHATAPLPDPRDENPNVPESIAMIVQRLMAKKPEDRYQTPQELLDDLENSYLHRQAPSDQLFSALATSGDSRTDVPSADPQKREVASSSSTTSSPDRRTNARPHRKHRSGENSVIPPRHDHRAAQQPVEQKAQRSAVGSSTPELLKYVVIAGVVIGVFVGIWYLVSGLASGLSGGTDGVGKSQRHIADEMLNENAAAPPTVTPRRETPIPAPIRRPQSSDVKPEEVKPEKVTQAQLSRPVRPAPSQELSKTPLLNPELELTVPQWAQVVPMADEIERLFADWKPKVVTVGRWQNKIGSHHSLNAAFAENQNGNLWVRLIGPGPFVLNPIQLKDRNLILSTDSVNAEPVVVCLADPQHPADEFLNIENGSLLLAGVNFVSAAHQFPSERAASLISLTDGDFFMRDVTMTLYGKGSAPAAAVTLKGTSDEQSARALIDRSLIRGAWTALDTKQDRCSILLVNSLVLTDGVPAIAVTGPESASFSTDSPSDAASRRLSILQSTCVSSGTILSVAAGESRAQQFPVTFDVEYSILTTPPGNSSPLLTLGAWPAGNRQAGPLSWNQNQSLLAGWKTLISAPDSAFKPVSEFQDWNAFWDTHSSAHEFLEEPLAEPLAIASPTVDPEQWRWNGRAIPASNLAGFPAGSILGPNSEQQMTASALTRLEASLPIPFQKPPVDTIELDLDRINLQQRLSQKDWKSGTRFLLSGTKPNLMTPVEIDGRSLILEMAPGQPDSFRLEPRGSQKQPLITVRNGSLSLKNLRLKIPNRTRGPAPQWAVSVVDGSLIVEDSLLEGPYIANENHRGLVHWSTGGAGRSLRSDSPHRHLCSLRSSYLTTFGTTLYVQPQEGLVRLRDTTLAAEGTAVSLNLARELEAATLDFRKSTLSASEAVFSLAGTPNDRPLPTANCIIRECVFAAPLPGAPKAIPPTLLEASSDWVDRRHLLWWEQANAYSTEISCFIRPAEGDSILRSFEDWESAWGFENVQKPLHAPDGVLLKENYPERASLPPELFQLDEKSRALSWAPDGTAVGATPAEYLFLITTDDEKKDTNPSRSRSNF